jgi:uncharacterized membrane protein
MLSGHFPSTFSHPNGWVILTVLALSSAGIRHLMNIRFGRADEGWLWPAIGVVRRRRSHRRTHARRRNILSPGPGPTSPVAFTEVRGIMHRRCTPCHSSTPTRRRLQDRPQRGDVRHARRRCGARPRHQGAGDAPEEHAARERHGMTTDAERATLRAWIDQGAKGP